MLSEARRDIELVGIVGHVGGVYIEASVETIEMRKAFLTEMRR